jgi:putative two-component system response regulator
MSSGDQATRPDLGFRTILVVEDELAVRDTMTEALGLFGYRVTAVDSAEAALIAIERDVPDLVLTDVHMRAISGVELCRRIKNDPRFALVPVVILTGVADLTARVAGLDAGADDFFAKPVELTELRTRVAALLRVKSLVDELEHAEGVIGTLALTIEARDPYTMGHCERMSYYAVSLGRALGADRALLRALQWAGYLHDLGKIAVPDGVLLKPGPLTPEERVIINRHPEAGADLVRGLHTLEDVRPLIRHHHERWDGSGYPDRLAGEAIPLGARIMAVTDVFDALHTARPYKKSVPVEEALDILRREVDRGFWEPRIVSTFVDLVQAGLLKKGPRI